MQNSCPARIFSIESWKIACSEYLKIKKDETFLDIKCYPVWFCRQLVFLCAVLSMGPTPLHIPGKHLSTELTLMPAFLFQHRESEINLCLHPLVYLQVLLVTLRVHSNLVLITNVQSTHTLSLSYICNIYIYFMYVSFLI